MPKGAVWGVEGGHMVLAGGSGKTFGETIDLGRRLEYD
jgi:hypothetical protein